MSKNRLGRGLDALIPTDIDEFVADTLPDSIKPNKNSVAEIDVDKIVPNPNQPRTEFNQDELSELSKSIEIHGIIQPLVVVGLGGGKYQLIAGERRLRASKLAGIAKVPAIIRTFSEQQQLELALIENIQRSELSPLEIAVAYVKLIDQFNLTHEQIAKRVGKAASTVSNTIRLVNLPHPAKLALQKGEITEGHARAILSVDDPSDQLQLLEVIVKSKLSVRDTETLAKNYKTSKLNSEKQTKTKAEASQGDDKYEAISNRLAKQLATKVSIKQQSMGGKIVIDYYSDEELYRIASEISGLE